MDFVKVRVLLITAPHHKNALNATIPVDNTLATSRSLGTLADAVYTWSTGNSGLGLVDAG